MRLINKYLILIISMLFLTSCSTAVFTGFDTENKAKVNDIATQNCDLNNKNLKYDDKENPQNLISIKDPVYHGSYLGYKAFLCGEFQKSINIFNIVEDNYRFSVDEENIAKKAGKEVLHAVTNQNATDYEGLYFERILTNTYKAMDYLALKDYGAARVEINRAINRQEIARDEFEKAISKKREKLNSTDENNNMANKIIQENFDFLQTKAYKDFTNPFVSYFAGLFFVLDKDYSKARFQFRETSVQENNIYIAQDYILANTNFNIKENKKSKNKIISSMDISNNGKYVWLIFDNGYGLNLKETNFTIPFMVTNDGVAGLSSLNFAMATLGDSYKSYDYLFINDKDTKLLSDMDSVITAEYKANLAYRVTKTIINLTAKTALNTAATKEDRTLGLATNIFTFLTNHADTRYFVGVPKEYQVARVPNNGKIIISNPNKEIILEENLNPNKHFVIYIKSPIAGVFYKQIFEER